MKTEKKEKILEKSAIAILVIAYIFTLLI